MSVPNGGEGQHTPALQVFGCISFPMLVAPQLSSGCTRTLQTQVGREEIDFKPGCQMRVQTLGSQTTRIHWIVECSSEKYYRA